MSTPPLATTPAPFLRLQDITKRYGGVTALANVDFACSLGTIHAVVGENGAGKSSLMKLIAGVIRPDEGEISVEDKPMHFASPADAAALGICCIFPELALLPDLSVADNISLADPPKRCGLIDRRLQRQIAEEVLHRVGCGDIHPDERAKDLPLSRQQMVEIAKALVRNPRLIIMDEATSALTARDVEHLYRIVRGLRDQGVAVLYISHRMPEISALADICSVFRNGKHIETFQMSSRTTEEIVPMMIGREVARAYPKKYESSTPSAPSTSVHSVHSRTTPKTRIGEVSAISVVSSPNQSRFGLIDHSRERAAPNDRVATLQILTHNLASPVRTLSGGTQQKVVSRQSFETQPRILLLNDPTRGIDVGTKQELYRLMRELAQTGIGILFYSTDYEELIGMCDRVAVCYGGKLVRELSGPDLNEHDLISASLNLGESSAAADSSSRSLETGRPKVSAWQNLNRFWKRNAGPALSFLVFAIMFILFASQQSNGLSTNVLTSVSNKGAVLAYVAIAQTLVILTGGFDLSVGMIMTMASCLASVVLNGSPGQTALGAVAVLASGLLAGVINAMIVVLGRIQPIIATLATGPTYFGIGL